MILSEVDSQEDFDELIDIYRMSEAPIEVRKAAIEKAKKEFPEFDTDKIHQVRKDVMDNIRDGRADLPSGID